VFDERDLQTLSMSERAFAGLVLRHDVGSPESSGHRVHRDFAVMTLILGNTVAWRCVNARTNTACLRAIGFLTRQILLGVSASRSTIGVLGGGSACWSRIHW